MGRASSIQHTFNAGEFSPLMLARQDLEQYAKALAICLNAHPYVQGAWGRRSGTIHLLPTKYSGTRKSRWIPFQYSLTQAYALEVGHQYIRFYAGHGLVVSAQNTITGITKANPAVLSYSGTDNFANGNRVIVQDVEGMTQVNNREFIVANVNVGANTFELQTIDAMNLNSTGFDTYTTGGTVSKVLEVGTAFDETDLPYISVVQSADVLFIFHPDFPPQQLVRTSATTWSLSNVVFLDGPYDSTNTTTTTFQPAATSGNTTITASSTTGVNGGLGFLVTDVGRLIRIKHTSTWGYAVVTARNSNVQVNVTVLSNFAATTASVDWRMGIWSDTTGWPVCGTFHEDRLVLGGAALFPQRIDGSKSGQYTNFAPTDTAGVVAENNAIGFTMAASDVNGVQWIKSNEKGLLVGTSSAEWILKPSALASALSPTNISGKPSTNFGSAVAQPINAGKAVLFLQRGGRKIRELAYVFETDGFQSPDLTLLAEHITRPTIVEMAYQQQPQATVWAVRSDGILLGFTYERSNNVTAWHRHQLAGVGDAVSNPPSVESVCVIPSPDGTRDELYLTVKRYINGQTVRHNELMTKVWEPGDFQENAFYGDNGDISVNTPAVSVITGLNWLEGESVGVLVDGALHPDATVTNGKITLNYSGTIVNIGERYNSDGVSLALEGGAQDGSAQGKLRIVRRIGFWLLDTLNLEYGRSFDNLAPLLERVWGDEWGAAPVLFTGVKRERFEGDFDRIGQVYWRANTMYPAVVLAMMPQFDVSDDT